MSKFVKDNQGNYKDSDGFELINQFDGTFQVLDSNGYDISGEYETLKQAKQTVKDYKFFNKETISGTMTRFKKGSKEAKAFMAKLRASKKGAKKKKKVSGLKITPKPNVESRLQFGKRGITVKPIKRKSTSKKRKISGNTHTDTKSHNYKINISGNRHTDIAPLMADSLHYKDVSDILKSIQMELSRINMLKKRILFCTKLIKDKRTDKKEVSRLKNVIKDAKLFIGVYKQNIVYLKRLIK
jgi:hypothetical protein